VNAKHTPGPWETSKDAVPEGHIQITVYEPTGRRVATVFETEANARLIAAAPDLLKELKDVREWIQSLLDATPDEATDFITNNGEQVEQAIADAIVKAEGKDVQS